MSRTDERWDIGEITHGLLTNNVTWEIKDYFGFPEEVDLCLRSPTFSFLDATWYLELWPNGNSEKRSEGWISLYLIKKHSNTLNHQIQYTIGIMGPDSSIVRDFKSEKKFEGNDLGFGLDKFYEVPMMNQKRNETAPEGVLTVVCNMSANMPEGVQTATSSGVDKLVHDFKDLLQSKEASDVTLSVKGRKFQVHKAVLVARSRTFSAMFKRNMKKKNSGLIQIDDCDPSAFQLFLTYLYSGDLENISSDIVFSLHKIADKYEVEDLKTRCVQFVMDNLSVEIFCDAVCLSLRHREAELLKLTADYFAKNLKEILDTPGWLLFAKENLEEANELYLTAVDRVQNQSC